MICCKLNKAMKTILTQMIRYMTDVVVVVTVLFVKVYMAFSYKAYWSNFWGGIILKSVRFGSNLNIRRGTKSVRKSVCPTPNPWELVTMLYRNLVTLKCYNTLFRCAQYVMKFTSKKLLAVFYNGETLHKNWSFQVRFSTVNVTKL